MYLPSQTLDPVLAPLVEYDLLKLSSGFFECHTILVFLGYKCHNNIRCLTLLVSKYLGCEHQVLVAVMKFCFLFLVLV